MYIMYVEIEICQRHFFSVLAISLQTSGMLDVIEISDNMNRELHSALSLLRLRLSYVLDNSCIAYTHWRFFPSSAQAALWSYHNPIIFRHRC
jgi:hypothetical protein